MVGNDISLENAFGQLGELFKIKKFSWHFVSLRTKVEAKDHFFFSPLEQTMLEDMAQEGSAIIRDEFDEYYPKIKSWSAKGIYIYESSSTIFLTENLLNII